MLDDIISLQKAVLGERRYPFMKAMTGYRAPKKLRGTSLLQAAAHAQTCKERWELYSDTLEEDFFTSPEAKMRISTSVRKGKAAYQGLRINEHNSEDMKSIFASEWEGRQSLGLPLGT